MLLKPASSRAVHFSLAFAVCLSAFSVDVAIPALSAILQHFDAPDSSGHQVVGFYLIGFAAGQVPLGFLSDRYGRLPVFYGSIAIFIAVSFATVFATSMEMLLWARLIQGFAGAGGPVLSRAIARDIASGRELARLTSLLVSALAVSTLAAPAFGAGLMELWGWRATFGLSLLMGVLSLGFFILFIKETKPGLTRDDGLIEQFFTSAKAFFATPQSIWGTGLVSLTFFAYMGIVAGVSQVVVDVFGMTSRGVALAFGGAVLFYLASAQAGRRALDSYSPLQLIRFGFWGYLVSVCMCALVLWAGCRGFWFFWWSLIPFLVGMGLVFSNATAMTLAPLPESAGFAASILGTLQAFSAAFGALLVGFFYDRSVDSMVLVLSTGSLTAFILFWLGIRSPTLHPSTGTK